MRLFAPQGLRVQAFYAGTAAIRPSALDG